MRIFVENSGYALGNLGDAAMLQVALERLRRLWPEASLEVLTASPERLQELSPGVRPVLAAGARQWVYASKLPDRFGRLAPMLEQRVRSRLPGAVRCMALARMRLRGHDTSRLNAYLEAVESANLVVATGGGYLTDVFEEHARGVLSSLILGIHARTCTAMLGQGLGPLHGRVLRAEAAAALRSVGLITLRESRAGGPLLQELGVKPDRVMTTGDDAVELAYGARQSQIGVGIGVNLRVASYSGVDSGLVGAVRSAIGRGSREHQAPLVPAPISTYQNQEADSDARSIRELVGGLDLAAGVEFEPQTPLELIRQIGQCRVVVTGSYHAGVFALSQGIPVICLARSVYYRDKFLGLSEQFGTGCWVVMLDDNGLQERMTSAIRDAWNSAGQMRAPLRAAARRQIEAGQAAYQRLYELVAGQQRTRGQHCHAEERRRVPLCRATR